MPRSHTEQVGEQARLGAWISHQRVEATKVVCEHVKELSELGMRG